MIRTAVMLLLCPFAALAYEPGDPAAPPGDGGESVVPGLVEELGRAMAGPRSGGKCDALLEKIRSAPRKEVIKFIRDTALGETPLHRRILALQILAALGGDASLTLLREIWTDMPRGVRLSPVIHGAFRRSLSGLIAGEPALCATIRRDWRGIPGDLRVLCAQAAAGDGGRAGVDCLAGLVGNDNLTTVLALDCLAGLPALRTGHLREPQLRRVAEELGNHDPEVRRAAAAAAGRLHVAAAAEALIALLADEHAKVRTASLRALRAMSGLGLPEDAELWSVWLRQERDWFERDCDDACELLISGGGQRVLTALRGLSRHRLHREQFVDAVIPELANEDEMIRIAACDALAALGSTAPIWELIDALDDPEDAVRAAAAAALSRVTGLKPPASPEEWPALIRGQ